MKLLAYLLVGLLSLNLAQCWRAGPYKSKLEKISNGVYFNGQPQWNAGLAKPNRKKCEGVEAQIKALDTVNCEAAADILAEADGCVCVDKKETDTKKGKGWYGKYLTEEAMSEVNVAKIASQDATSFGCFGTYGSPTFGVSCCTFEE